MKELLKKHWAAFDASDWTGYKADLAAEFEFDEAPTGKHGNGDEYLATLKQWKATFPDAKTTFKNIYEAGDTVIAEVEWRATHKGTLEGPFGSLPATNKPIVERGVLVYKVKDGKFVSGCSYFDLLGMMQQLGVAPTMGAPAAKPEAEKRAVH